MSDLDLDALERVVADAKAKSFDSLAFSMDTVVIDQLIQRLREAEATVEESDGAIERLTVRIDEAISRYQVINKQQTATAAQFQIYMGKAETRIAQLERVREAALWAEETTRLHSTDPELRLREIGNALRAALAAVEEPAKL